MADEGRPAASGQLLPGTSVAIRPPVGPSVQTMGAGGIIGIGGGAKVDDFTRVTTGGYVSGGACAISSSGGWGIGPLGEWIFPDHEEWAPNKAMWMVNGTAGRGFNAGDEPQPCSGGFWNSLHGLPFEQCEWPLELLADFRFGTILPAGATGATDLFNREVTGSWGTSELPGGYSFLSTSQSGVSVTGGVAKFTTTNRVQRMSIWLDKPTEILYKVRIISTNGDALAGHGGFDSSLSITNTGVAFWTLSKSGSTLTPRIKPSGSTVQTSGAAISGSYAGQWVWVRSRISASTYTAKFWLDGDPEPAAPQLSVATDDTMFRRILFQNGSVSGSSTEWDQFTIVGSYTLDNLLELYFRFEQPGFEFYNQFGSSSADYNVVDFEMEVGAAGGSSLDSRADSLFWGVAARSEIDVGWMTPAVLPDYESVAFPNWQNRAAKFRLQINLNGEVYAKVWFADQAEPGWQRQSFQPISGFSEAGFGIVHIWPISYWRNSRDTWFELDRLEFVSGLCGGGIALQGSGAYPSSHLVGEEP